MQHRCYIAGPISGLPEETYKANFEKAKRWLIKQGFAPVSPVDLRNNHDKTWASYMREAIAELVKCDYVYVLKGSGDSKGANLEQAIARQLGIIAIYQK